MSNSFYERVVEPAEEAERFITETGSLPEIVAAAEDLLTAIARTRAEIAGATFAPSRFPAELTPYQRNMVGILIKNPSPGMRTAIAAEGEAGMKRFSLQTRLAEAEATVFGAIQKIVEVRADLIVSQID